LNHSLDCVYRFPWNNFRRGMVSEKGRPWRGGDTSILEPKNWQRVSRDVVRERYPRLFR